ncbi:MAG: hypothetical protein ACRD3I_07430 [Terriglobales bacterium]
MRQSLAAAGFAVMAAAGCASFDGRGLVPGKSLEAEIIGLMGMPSQKFVLQNGNTALYFSRLPEGRAVYVVEVGGDGVMKSIEQRLVRKNIALIAANTSKKEEVLDLFGPPGRTGRLPLMPREWWEYKYFDYYERRIVWVQFSDDGVVREVIDMRDWDHERPRWPSWRRN